ncbi:MAG: branched-chain amino acid ABC transporter ATP-binding protein/permease [Burkholderiaceae bacterium]|nr:branched-chain amino acid ABC transporter ATP-binding protein/permease [Burkholderiaceae bacterium]
MKPPGRSSRRKEAALALLLIWCVAGVALLARNPYWISVATTVLMWVHLCVAWNAVGGMVGQISFGNAAFFGIGAYTSTFLAAQYGVNPWLGMLAGGALAAAAGWCIGYLPFRWRLSHLVFALLTMAAGFVLQFSANGMRALGGTGGLYINAPSSLANLRFDDPGGYLLTIAVLSSATLLVVALLFQGRRGYFWRAVRDNEDAAAAAGVGLFRVKQEALAVSAFATALAGTFYAQQIGFIDPHSVLGVDVAIQILLFAVVGGSGTQLGPVVGPLLLVPLGEALRLALGGGAAAELHHFAYGAALVAVILLWPGGVVGGVRRMLQARRSRVPADSAGSGPAPAAAGAPRAPTSSEGGALLEVVGIGKRFGGLQALQDVSFSVRRGEILGLIGPNGAGKTTLFSILGGFQQPSAGQVRYRGERIDGLAPHQICRRGVARTFQITQSFPTLTVFDTVLTAALVRHRMAAAPGEAEAVLVRTGLWDRRAALCADVTLAEQRRLEVARALATEPTLLLLDESMAGLTPRETDAALHLLRSLRDEGLTIVLIEHVMRAVMNVCDRLVVLDAGRLLASGTPSAVASDPQVIRAYLGAGAPER